MTVPDGKGLTGNSARRRVLASAPDVVEVVTEPLPDLRGEQRCC
jgi:hypothetical protein